MAMYTSTLPNSASSAYPLHRVAYPTFAHTSQQQHHHPHPSAPWVNGNGEHHNTESELQHQSHESPHQPGPWPSHSHVSAAANHHTQPQHASYTPHAHDASSSFDGQFHAQHAQEHHIQQQAPVQSQEQYHAHAYPQNIANTYSHAQPSPINDTTTTTSSSYGHAHPHVNAHGHGQQHYYVLHEQHSLVTASPRYDAPSGWAYPSSAQDPTYGRRPGSGPGMVAYPHQHQHQHQHQPQHEQQQHHHQEQPQQQEYAVKVEATETTIPTSTSYSLWTSPQSQSSDIQESYQASPSQAPVQQYQPASVPGFFDGDEPVEQAQYYQHEYTPQPVHDHSQYEDQSAYDSYGSQSTTYSVNQYYPQYDQSSQSAQYAEPASYESATPVDHRPPPLTVSPTSSFSQPWSPVTPVYSSSSLAGALTEVPRKSTLTATAQHVPSSATASPESTRSGTTVSSASPTRTSMSISPAKSTDAPLIVRPNPHSRPAPSRTSSSLLSITSSTSDGSLSTPVHGPAPPGTSKKPLHRSLACLECRSRKVACSLPSAKVKKRRVVVKADGSASDGLDRTPEVMSGVNEVEGCGEEKGEEGKVPGEEEGDFTCRQCLRRGRVCVYPAENMRGRHKVEAKQARLAKEKEEKEAGVHLLEQGCKTEEVEGVLVE